MKYELTQGQYVDFLNMLAADQTVQRGFTVNSNRVHIAGVWPTYSTNFPHRAMAYLSYVDLLSYLDWAGLSPMTEFEYEKACRGPHIPVAGEYAWGTTGIVNVNNLSNDGTPTETHAHTLPPGAGPANMGGDVVIGPLRVGFAASGTTNRVQAGASYYGVMELSGNVWEWVIGLSANVSGFTGLHGNGELSTSLNPPAGRFDVQGWPASSTIIRGGSWNDAAGYLTVSYRQSNGDGRFASVGGRGVRRIY